MTTSNGALARFRKWGASCFLNGLRVGAGQWGGPGAWLGSAAHSLGRAVCRDPAQDLQKRQVGFWSFCILSIICPSCVCTQLFLVPYSFFVSVAAGDVCPGASTAAKGPGSQPMSLWCCGHSLSSAFSVFTAWISSFIMCRHFWNTVSVSASLWRTT